ncbi:hypothetical protein DEO72_LG10g3012 [Vigna unguiculata]|uniref:Uncharacterized protein n=1 Tax=Vigna unguiculata TaxID=3917 RepID=A0A4D6NI10_VIGUN|nr:hypothetical protein DEO72_LG10g3012 [Vigna unguiculata]
MDPMLLYYQNKPWLLLRCLEKQGRNGSKEQLMLLGNLFGFLSRVSDYGLMKIDKTR